MDFRVCVVLPAGGTGERTGLSTPKQFCIVQGRPLVAYTIETFSRLPWIDQVVMVVAHSRRDYMQQMVTDLDLQKVRVTESAETRHRSIFNGVKALAAVKPPPDVVIIHDAVRPFVDEETVKSVAVAANSFGAAGVVRPLVSTVVKPDQDGFMDSSLIRADYRASEMPQAFQYDVIRQAYEKCTDHDLDFGTECLQLARKYTGVKVKLIEGPSNLWKVTFKKDLYAMEGILKDEESLKTVITLVGDGAICQQWNKAIQQHYQNVHIYNNFEEESQAQSSKENDKHIISFHTLGGNNLRTKEHLLNSIPKMTASDNGHTLRSVTLIIKLGERSPENSHLEISSRASVKEESVRLKGKVSVYGVLVKDLANSEPALDLVLKLLQDKGQVFSGQVLDLS